MIYCTRCGKMNPDHTGFCMRCGAEMPPMESILRLSEAGPACTGPAENSGKAIGSLICGVLFMFFPAAVAAIVLGHLAQSQIRNSGGRLKGAGMATTGLILGYIGVAFIPIILIVAAIAIPNLLRARMAANEASALGSLRRIDTALETYSSNYGHGFPEKLETLGPPSNGQAPDENAADLINSFLARGRMNGYAFSYVVESKKAGGLRDAYEIGADPVAPGSTGRRHFFIDETGVIRVESDRAATKDSPPLQ
ncbi:MAG: DUF4190 domain-containing protein [Candidatus Acidiferrales bacterium]